MFVYDSQSAILWAAGQKDIAQIIYKNVADRQLLESHHEAVLSAPLFIYAAAATEKPAKKRSGLK